MVVAAAAAVLLVVVETGFEESAMDLRKSRLGEGVSDTDWTNRDSRRR